MNWSVDLDTCLNLVSFVCDVLWRSTPPLISVL